MAIGSLPGVYFSEKYAAVPADSPNRLKVAMCVIWETNWITVPGYGCIWWPAIPLLMA